MASRVNVKFVVILSAALVALAVGVAGVFFVVKLRSGDRFVRMGDTAMARGDAKAADEFYARAVAKDQTRLDWLNKWRAAREKKIPDTETVFESDYRMYVYGILRTLATVQRTNVEAHREYLQSIYEQLLGGSGTDGWTFLVTETEAMLRYFDEANPPAPLRRYRGLAYAAIAATTDIKDARKTAMADLEAAVKADAKDTVAASELALFHQLEAQRIGDDKPDQRKAEMDQARSILDAAAAANPQDAFIALSRVNLDAAEADSIQLKGRPISEVMKARDQALAPLAPRLEASLALLESSDPKALNSVTIMRAAMLASRLLKEPGLKRVAAVSDRMITARPQDPEPLLIRAQLYEMAGEHEAMLPVMQKILELPELPVGLPGLKLYTYRRNARVAQTNIAISLALREQDPAARAKALATARAYREALKGKVSEELPELMFLDGKFRHADGDYRGAQRSLDSFLKTAQPGSPMAVEAMGLMADIGLRLDPPQPGLSRDYLTKVCAARPGQPEPLLTLAALEARLEQYDAALRIYRRVLDIDPTNEIALRQVGVIEALTSKAGDKKVSDPVEQTLIDSDRLVRGDQSKIGDVPGAIKFLEDKAPTLNFDARIMTQIAQLKLSRGDRDGARAAIQTGLDKHPDHAGLKESLSRLETYGDTSTVLAAIDASGRPEVDRRLARYNVLFAANEKDKADAELTAAEKLAPDDTRVLELVFVRALSTKDLTKAAAYADRAATLDTDRAEGETFRARLLLAQGNPREAAAMLQRAVDRGNANAAVFRFLGNVQLQLGRGPEAIKSYRRALELSPTDLLAAKTLMEALVRLDQPGEALAVARSVSSSGRDDAEFLNQWLSLEAAAGDSGLARSMREQILARSPEDKTNKAALADLYIKQREWDKSRAIIDELRKSGDSLALVALDARWYAGRGDVSRARKAFIEHISALQAEKKLTSDPFLVMAQFLLEQGEANLALEALRNGAYFQDAKTRPVDQAIGELELSRGRYDKAEETYSLILSSGVADPDRRLRKRYIESLVQQKKTADAEREFVTLGEAVDGDVELLCQRALNALNAGQTAQAQQLYDRAVARFPDEPIPYIGRARMLMVDPAMASDALADLATALRLRPGSGQVLRTRAMILTAQGKPQEALRDLRAAVDANPRSDEARVALVQALLTGGDEPGAIDAIEAGLKDRQTDVRQLVLAGDLLARAGRTQRAAGYYKRVWQQTGAPADASRYATTLMAANDLAGAEAYLATPALDVPKSPVLLMTRALLRTKQNRVKDAQEDCYAALGSMLKTDGIMQWADQVRAVFTDLPTAMRTLEIGFTRLPAESAAWGEYARAAILGREATGRSEAEAMAENLLPRVTDNNLKLDLYRLLSSLYTADQAWDKALNATLKGLEVSPDDVMFNNNAAVFLAEHLSRPGEAGPYAEKAMAKSQGPEVLDTVAGVLWNSGKKPEAIGTLERAATASTDAGQRLTILFKLADWKAESGDRQGAQTVLRRIRELLIDFPSIKDSAKDKLAALEARLR